MPRLVISSWFIVHRKDKQSINHQPPTTTQLGFTLVELLVVISIISVLAVMGFAAFRGFAGRGNDAKRRADVDAISKAFEANYNNNSVTPYGAPLDSWFSSGAVPTDPTNNDEYWWNGQQTRPAASATYVICAQLQNAYGNSTGHGDASGFTAATGATATHYCSKNQQ